MKKNTTKNALIIGIRNEDSICSEIALELKRAGYALYATYQDESTFAEVSRVAEKLNIKRLFAYDARKDEDLDHFAAAMQDEGVGIDVLVHGISYSTAKGARLGCDLVELSWEDFTDAIRVGAFSLVEISGHLLDVFNEGASILSISSRWSRVAVPGFNIVCAAKAGLESMIRGLAESLGEAKHIRVNGISPGFVPTYSLTKVGNSLEILDQEKQRSPLARNVDKEDIAGFAVSILENRSITSMIFPVDTGVNIMG